jgi:hypothetical protein
MKKANSPSKISKKLRNKNNSFGSTNGAKYL